MKTIFFLDDSTESFTQSDMAFLDINLGKNEPLPLQQLQSLIGPA